MADPANKERLLTWFHSNNGTLHPSLKLSHSPDSGQHFRATIPITASESSPVSLCTCPFALTLSYLNVLPSPTTPRPVHNESSTSICRHLLSHTNENDAKLPTAAVSYFFLCEQRLLGKDSFWASYIEALPREDECSTPWWFAEEDLMWLRGTSVHVDPEAGSSGVEMRRGMWRGWWEEGVRVLGEVGEGEEERVDRGIFTW